MDQDKTQDNVISDADGEVEESVDESNTEDNENPDGAASRS